MIIHLNYKHYDQCMKMLDLKNKIAGTTPSLNIESQKEKLKKFFDSDNQYCSFGIIENGEVTSWMTIFFEENKTRGKFWGISTFFTNKFSNYFTFKFNGPLLRTVIDFAESKEYWQFYYSLSERINNAYSLQWSKSNLERRSNYTLKDLAIIPAFTKPESELYWRLMGEEIKPDNIIIKYRAYNHNK